MSEEPYVPYVEREERWDKTTARFREETGHDCLACPSAVRDLYATAHNAASQLRATLESGEDVQRAWRKLVQLEMAVERWERVVEGNHFAAMNNWRRP